MARTFYISVEKRGTVTNGDMIKALFPNIDIDDLPHFPLISLSIPFEKDNGATMEIRKDWWNAPYKAESEVNADDSTNDT